MKRTMMYSVGGQTLTVDPDNDQQFNESAMSSGYEAKPVRRFRVSGRTIDLADDEVNDFFTAAKSAGYTPEELRTYKMADGSAREMSGSEMSRYLRSPEYRESEDYEESRKKLNDELGSPMWAAIKGAISGGIEGALEGGKAGVAKAAWALPQVGTGVMRAVGNLANGLGNGRNALGDALVRGANAADAKMEEIMPTSTAERLGYEDWGTKTGDFFGNVAGMAVKFAPAGGTSLAAKVFTEAMLASDGVNAYEGTLRTAQENGADVATANALGMVSGLVNYFGGKALLKAGGVSKDIKNPLLRELAAAATSGGVMGVQGGANKAIENAATNKDVGEGVLGAVGEGLAEGALFHGANMIPRAPSLVRQTKAHFNAAKDWITEAAANDPAMLSDLMDQPALDEVIAARRKGESVSRKMGDDIFLPNNMSGEQRNAVVDSIIAYRDGAAEAAKNAEATKAKEKQAAADKRGEQAVRTFREGEERARAEFNAEARKNGDDAPDAELERQPVTRNEGRGENADILQQSADQYARDDADGAKAYGSWLKKQGKKDTAANRMDWFVNDYAKRGDHPLTHRATENEIPDISREEYDKAISDWTAKKESAQKQGKKFDEPKPYAEYEDYDALLAEQKSRMDAADRAAAEAAHEERGKGLAEAFADWREESVKAQKQGKKSPEPTAEVEDVRAKAEADAVVQRLNTEWQKAKTPAERNAIKAQLIDRLKQMGIGATERGTSAAEKAAEPAKPQTADNTPSRAPTETQPTSRPEGADGKEARNGASDGEYIDWEGATANKTYKIRVKMPDFPEINVEKPTSREDYLRKWDDVVKQIDEAKRKLTKSPPVNRKTGKHFKPNSDEYRKWQAQEYALDEKARRVYAEAEKRMGGDVDDLFPEAEDVVAPPVRVPDGKGKMVEKPSGDVSSDSVKSELERYVGKDELSKIKDKAYSTELEDGGSPEDISILAETCRGIANRTGNPPSAKSLAEAVADAWSRHTYESIKATADIVKDAYKRDGKKVPKVFADEYGIEPDADFYQKNAKSEEERLVSVYGKKPQPSQPLENATSRAPHEKGTTSQAKGAEGVEARSSVEIARSVIEGDALARKVIGNAEISKDVADRIANAKARLDEAEKNLDSAREMERTDLTKGGNTKPERRKARIEANGRVAEIKREISDEILALVKSAKEKSPSTRVPDGKGKMVEKPAPSPETKTKSVASAPVVEKAKGGEVAVEAPDSIEAKIGAMPYGQERRKAQFDYMDAEVKKAKEAIKGKFTQGKDKKWTTEDKSVAPTITVKVPADGEFTVANNPDGIALLEKISAKLKAIVADRARELPTGSKNVKVIRPDVNGMKLPTTISETVWTKDKPQTAPKSPSLAVKKPAKNITVKDAAEIVKPFVDKDRKSLTKPHVGDGVVVATDGRRLVVVDVPGAKESGEEYPNWKQVIPKKTAHEAKFSTEELYTKLEQAKVVVMDDAHSVEIYELADGSLGVQVKSEAAEYSTHEKMPKNARLVGMFNVDFLLDATKTAAKMGDKEMRIGYNDSYGPVIHRGNGYKQVIMPLRLSSVEPADRLAALRSDAKVKSWAQKNGYSVVEGEVSPRAVAEYLRSQTKKAVAATKRLFKDAEVEVKDRDWNAEIDGENGALRDNEGRVVGTFDLATKKVTLYRGADERTVYHELIGHGVEDWARRNNTALHDKLTELARTAPRELVEDVRSRYPDADEATLTKEIIARVAEGKGLENIKLKDAPKTWYAKAYVAVKDALVGFMEKIGLNRIDLSKTDDMTPSEAMDYLMREIGKGRTLGEIGTAEVQGKMTRAEKWANKYYDRHTSLGKVSKEAADAKALQPGREAEFEIMKFNPKKEEFKKLLKDGNVTGNEVDEYMRAVAAKERNAADGRESSGMSGERIDATLRFYENHPRIDAIKEAADFMWKLQDEGMRERIRSGLVSEAEYDEWKAREEHHVPFRSAVDENGDHIAWNDPRGVAGHEFVQHEGRYSESGSPTAWMFEEYANAHLRAIENDTRKVLADAVSRDASLGAVTTNPNLRESRLNGDGGDRNVVSYKAIGENGRAVVKHIVLKGERGAAAASSYTNRDLMNKSPLLKKTQAFMRFWSSTATEWSPTFALRNTFADNVDLAAVVLAEKGAKEGGAWIKDYAKNRVAVAKEVWRFARKGEVDADSTLGRYVKEGGMIGGFQREGYGDLVKQFSAEDIAKDFSNGGNRAKAVAKKVFGLVGAVNTYAELMTRVSAFKTNLDNGMSAKDAALWSRRVSVDFNRKGNVTPITNTLFMFSNSTIGATMRQLEAVNTAWKTPQGKRALLGLAAFGVAEALLEHAMNADSDEEREKKGEATGKDVNEFTRKTSLYVRVGGHVFRAPAHEDPLMKIVYAANSATRVMLGTMSKEDFAKEVGLGIAEDVPRFFGQGSKNMDAGFNTWVPTALQPLIQGIENKDYAGRPIYRPKYNESLPDSSNGRKSTQTQYKWAAETVNELTGGNKGRKGSVDIAPETVKLISESLGKNVGKDIGNAIDVGWNLLTGNFGDLDSRRAPIVRDVVRKTEGNDNRYFEAVRRFNADKLDLQTRDKARNWGEGERRAYYEAHPHLRKNGGTSTRVERLINGHTDGDTHVPGINDLRRMEGGERRVKTAAGWKWRAYDWSAEKVEEFKRKRLEKQAKVLAIMGD